MNTLKLSGNFTVAEMNAWTSVCLPEVPEKTASTSAVEYFYYSPFIDTEIICTIKQVHVHNIVMVILYYRKGMAEFQSDSLTSLMILQEAVCREATARMRQVATDTAINMKAMQALLSKLHAKLKYQQNLGQSVKLLEAISVIFYIIITPVYNYNYKT